MCRIYNKLYEFIYNTTFIKETMILSIEENIGRIKNSIPKDVTLISVTKTRNIDEIKKAYEAGERDFGENKVQEFIDKFDEFDSSVKWHFLGHLQTNKVKYIVGKVYLIHSLDSVKLLKEIEKKYESHNLTANVLIQINIGKEPSKTGIFEENLEELLFEAEKCSNVKVKGLMAVIPKGSEAENKRYFRAMRTIWENIKEKQFKNVTMEYLSMGMTNDYKEAISEGANLIRIGEGIFGKRNYNK